MKKKDLRDLALALAKATMRQSSVLASDVPDVPGTSSRTPGDVWKSAFWVFFGRRGRHQDA